MVLYLIREEVMQESVYPRISELYHFHWKGDEGTVCTLEGSDYAALLPKRNADSNKGTYGKLLMITGSKGMSGAAYLGALAAYRTGTGLVQIYTAKENLVILQSQIPEAIITTYEKYDVNELHRLIDWADVVAYRFRTWNKEDCKEDFKRNHCIYKETLCHRCRRT